MGKFRSTKKYTHESGFSCAFRQWRAESHCHYVHGYALAFEFVFETEELDVRNWCVDFGGMKSLKGWLEDMFDHTTLVAEDDPHIDWYEEAHKRGIIDMRVVPASGCERMAEFVYEYADQWLKDAGYGHVKLVSVQVWEHGANSALHVAE